MQGLNRPGGHPGSSAPILSVTLAHAPHRFHAPGKLACCFPCPLLPVFMIDRSTTRSQPDRRFLPAAAAASACTWTYVRAEWLEEMGSLFVSSPRNRRWEFESDWRSGTLTPPASWYPVGCGPLLSASHRYRRDKLAKWPLQRPGDASRLRGAGIPLKKETGAAAWVRHFDKPGRRIVQRLLAVVMATFLAAVYAVDKHTVWYALVFPCLDFNP